MRRGRGISSIYGFIMIFLLSMASIQTWSSAVGSLNELQGASDQSHQLEQMQGLERLSLSLSNGNLTVTNDGQIPSSLLYLRLVSQNDSKTIALDDQLAVGGSIREAISGSGDAIEVVTSLGNVFVLSPQDGDPVAAGFWTGQSTAVGGDSDMELFQSASDPSLLFVASGPAVYAFTIAGNELWSFNPGQGYVTDVMPIGGGDVFVSVGYGYTSNSAQLYELGPTGGLIASYPVRLDQIVDESLSLQGPVSKGSDSSYALYDGWFYSAGGPVLSIPSDNLPFAASDSSDFYFYQSFGEGQSSGSCAGAGDDVKLYGYATNPPNDNPTWTDTFYLATCNSYPPQLVAATAGNGLFVSLFSGNAFGEADLPQYSGGNPYLLVVNTAGSELYESSMPTNDYSSSIATDGSNVYLALPQSDQVQVVNVLDRSVTSYGIGFPASQLVWDYGSLFAVSGSEVKVYGSRMNLEKTISFAPLALASSSNAFLQEQSLHNPSFIALNSTSYAALLENSTGYATMVIGNYS
jgi:hypothetical protein